MRDKILKIYVTEENLEIARKYGCKEISFYKKSDNLDIKKYDFVIFSDEQGNEVLRNLWEIKENHIHYTTGWMGNSDNFPCIVIIANLYESIMHLRLETYVEQKFFRKSLAVDMVKRELDIIKLCIQLLEGTIDITSYRKELHFLAAQLENYPFESSAAILKQYPLIYENTPESRNAINKIKTAIEEIQECLNNPKKWEQISRIAYRIHNEPTAILNPQ